MNVKINYTVDIEEVPNLIQDILTSCLQELSTLSSTKLNTFEVEPLLENIAHVRERLSWVDRRLEDSSNITIGYYSAKLSPPADPQPIQEDIEDEEQ